MPVDRRTFAKHLAAAAIAAAPASALRAEGEANGEPEPGAEKIRAAAPTDLLLELVKQFHPLNLDDEKLQQIRGHLAHHMSRSKVLGAFPLTNADEPAPVFAAWRSED